MFVEISIWQQLTVFMHARNTLHFDIKIDKHICIGANTLHLIIKTDHLGGVEVGWGE